MESDLFRFTFKVTYLPSIMIIIIISTIIMIIVIIYKQPYIHIIT